jgi:hypothetical protein
MTKIF